MELNSIGDVIASRELVLAQAGSTPAPVFVLLGKPQQLPGYEDYYCPYQIRGAGSEKVSYSCGVDSLQALQLALGTIAVELEVLNKDLGGKLQWVCDDKGGLGFPD